LAPMSEAAVALSLHLKALDWKLHLVSFDRSLPPPPPQSQLRLVNLSELSVCVCLSAWKLQLVSFDLCLSPPNQSFIWSISLNCLSVCVSLLKAWIALWIFLHESFIWSISLDCLSVSISLHQKLQLLWLSLHQSVIWSVSSVSQVSHQSPCTT
jgi:hypothetical protein